MGTLAGHLLPGSFFLLIGFYWSIITSLRYQHSRSKSSSVKRQNGYKTSVTMPCLCLPCGLLRRTPLESFFKLFMGSFGILGEYVTGYDFHFIDPNANKNSSVEVTSHANHDHNHNHEHSIHARDLNSNGMIKVWSFADGNIQHITMYFAFVLGAIIEILMHYRFDIPKKMDFICGIMGFGTEAILFFFHLHAREPIDIHLHTLLFYSVLGCIFFICLEIAYPHQILFTYGRILSTILQGTWFYEIGFILYPPFDSPAFKWDLNSHDQQMIVTASFCWHIFMILIILLIESWFFKMIYNSSKNLPLEMDDLIDIELQNESLNKHIRYRPIQYFDENKKEIKINSNDEDSNDELVTFQANRPVNRNSSHLNS